MITVSRIVVIAADTARVGPVLRLRGRLGIRRHWHDQRGGHIAGRPIGKRRGFRPVPYRY